MIYNEFYMIFMNNNLLIKELQKKCLDYLNELENIEKFKIFSKELIQCSIKKQLKKYLIQPSNMQYLEDDTSKFERENIIYVFSNCDCCEEHQRERPSLYDYNSGYMPEYPNPNIDWKLDTLSKIGKNNCNCPCRFVSRYICRIDNDEIILFD